MKQTKHTHFKMLLIAVLALLMTFALVACNNDKKNNNDNSSDEVSETELYSGTGGMWEFITKENLEFIYGFLYTEVQRQAQTSGMVQSHDYMDFNSNSNDSEQIVVSFNGAMIDVSSSEYHDYDFFCDVLTSNEAAAEFLQELEPDSDPEYTYVLMKNMVFSISTNFPHIDDVKAGNYNLDNLPGKQMKILNNMLMKDNIAFTMTSWGNALPYSPTISGSGMSCNVAYYDNAYSNCIIYEQEFLVSGGSEEYLNNALDGGQQQFDESYKSKIGTEYTEDSYIEVDKEEGYYHFKAKTKPGFRFESEAEGEASVNDYYYDSEEDLDAVIPSTTPDGKAVNAINYSSFDYRIHSVTIPVSVNSISYGAFTSCKGLQAVYYCGNEEQWNEINIKSGNDPLVNAKRYYFSEQPNNDGNHWHWNAQHKPEVWAN